MSFAADSQRRAARFTMTQHKRNKSSSASQEPPSMELISSLRRSSRLAERKDRQTAHIVDFDRSNDSAAQDSLRPTVALKSGLQLPVTTTSVPEALLVKGYRENEFSGLWSLLPEEVKAICYLSAQFEVLVR